MKHTLTLLLFVLISVKQQAQYVEAPSELKEGPKKNAFGVLINPAVAVMLGAGTAGLSYGVQYRRLIENNRRLRVGTYFQNYKSNDLNGTPYSMSDTSMVFRTRNEGYQYGEFRMGMEWSDFTKSMDGIYGLEVIAGLNNTSEELRLSERISSQSPSNIGIFQDEIANTLQSKTSVKSVVFGIAPTFGYRVTIQEHLELIAALSLEIVYSTPITDGYNRSSPAFSDNSGLMFHFRPMDLVLSYRF